MKLSVCAMFQNEGRYIREWIEFHLLQGVEQFYLYNRNSEDDTLSLLQPYIARGIVDLKHWPRPGRALDGREALIDAHQDCIDRFRGAQEWCAMIDTDEFLFPLRHNTVAEVLERTPEHWGAVGVHWMVFGAGEETAWRDAPVIERFTLRPSESNDFNRWYKSIVRLSDPDLATLGSTHRFRTRGGTFNENGFPLLGNENDPASSHLRLNHYFTKSRPEWEERHPLRQDGIDYERDERRWIDVQARDVDDRTIQRFLPALKRRLQ
jgi:hypothetical protein